MNQVEELELKIAKFLRAGVIFAGILMFAGWVSQLKMSGNPFFNFEMYDHLPLNEILPFYVYKKNWGILVSYAGLLTLISLPVIRVMLTAWLFFRQKEYILAMIALVVLTGLIISMSLGIEL